MDAQLEAYLTPLIPRLAGGVMRDAMRQLGVIWDGGNGAVPESFTVAFNGEDVEQEMWLTACEHEEILRGHLTNGNSGAISTVLKRGAVRMVSKEKKEQRAKKAALEGYETYDEEFYSIGALRRLLPFYLDGGVCEAPPASRELTWRVSGGGDGGYGEYLTVMTDIDVAFKRLSEAKRKILSRYFAYPQGSGGWTHNEIAGAMGMPPGELSSRVHRGLRVLQQELGGRNPWGK